MRDVGIKRSDVKRDKYGIVGKCVDCVQARERLGSSWQVCYGNQ